MKLGFIGTGNMASAIMGGSFQKESSRQMRSLELTCLPLVENV